MRVGGDTPWMNAELHYSVIYHRPLNILLSYAKPALLLFKKLKIAVSIDILYIKYFNI